MCGKASEAESHWPDGGSVDVVAAAFGGCDMHVAAAATRCCWAVRLSAASRQARTEASLLSSDARSEEAADEAREEEAVEPALGAKAAPRRESSSSSAASAAASASASWALTFG